MKWLLRAGKEREMQKHSKSASAEAPGAADGRGRLNGMLPHGESAERALPTDETADIIHTI